MFERLKPLSIALAIFPFGALAGFAMLIRSDKEITPRQVMDAMLTSGLLAVCVWWILHDKFGDERMGYVAGLSVLSGFGANSIIGALLKALDIILKRTLGVGITNDQKD